MSDAPQAVGKQSEFLLMNSKVEHVHKPSQRPSRRRGRSGRGRGDVARDEAGKPPPADVGGVFCGSGVNEFKCIHELALTSQRGRGAAVAVGDVVRARGVGLLLRLPVSCSARGECSGPPGLTYCSAFHLDMRWVVLSLSLSLSPSLSPCLWRIPLYVVQFAGVQILAHL